MKKAWLTNYHPIKETVLWKLALQARRTIFFYILIHEVMIENKDLLKGLNHSKGCIRFANPNKIDFEINKKLLVATVESGNKPC